MKNYSVSLSAQEQQEELRRFDAAAKRVEERVQGNKEAALEFLREVGYFELMHDEEKDQNATANSTSQ